MKVNNTHFPVFCLVLLLTASACEDLVEVDQPKSSLNRSTVFEDDITAEAAALELYARVTAGSFSNVTYRACLSSDDLMLEGSINDTDVQFYQNEILPINPGISEIWQYHYDVIYVANSVIEGLAESTNLTSSLKGQLMGEAKFFRAFQYFYLVNLFGDVPYVSTTNYSLNSLVGRKPVSEVYENIITDLLAAKALLSEDYSYSNGERVRVNKWVAAALLARVYLYREDWVHAEEQATIVINKTSLYTLNSDLGQVFLKNSIETIWQLIPRYPQEFTQDGAMLNKPFYHLDNARIPEALFKSFEANDNRKLSWVGVGNAGDDVWYYPVKYKETYTDTVGPDEYASVFRLAEQYLIRAEARAEQGKLTGANSAESDLNIIRARAGLAATVATTKEEMLSAIEQERKVELFTEWGHRWFDLKRTDKAPNVLSVVKPEWQDTDMFYPIPHSERLLNPHLTQNLGY